MPRIEVPTETLLVEMGDDGLNILETTMLMSNQDESAPVQCDICLKPLGKMKDVKRRLLQKIPNDQSIHPSYRHSHPCNKPKNSTT